MGMAVDVTSATAMVAAQFQQQQQRAIARPELPPRPVFDAEAAAAMTMRRRAKSGGGASAPPAVPPKPTLKKSDSFEVSRRHST